VKLLAIDTTEEACSAALLLGAEVRERFEIAPRRHSELILPMMDDLLAEAGIDPNELDALAFGRGPGSFTGVRIATAIIQGAAVGSALPVLPVSSLQALAQGVAREHGVKQVLGGFDARMGEVYWGAYRRDAQGVMRPVHDECVCEAASVPVPDGAAWRGAGSAWRTYREPLQALSGVADPVYDEAQVHARDVATIAAAAWAEGQALPADQALPVYLRDRVAWTKT
jgi:tRNA threonylcarbamoyladenosine biosynthesis protein TsaB